MTINETSLHKAFITISIFLLSNTLFSQGIRYTKAQLDSAMQSIMCDSVLNQPLRSPGRPMFQDGAMMNPEFQPLHPSCIDSTVVTFCTYEAKKQCSRETIDAFITEKLGFPQTLPEGQSSPAVGLRFIVYADGMRGKPQLVASAASTYCTDKVMEVVDKLPSEGWMPGKQRGLPDATWYNLNILCDLEE